MHVPQKRSWQVMNEGHVSTEDRNTIHAVELAQVRGNYDDHKAKGSGEHRDGQDWDNEDLGEEEEQEQEEEQEEGLGEDDDEQEEEEEEEQPRKGKGKANQFIDDEALGGETSDEADEESVEDEIGEATFIDDAEAAAVHKPGSSSRHLSNDNIHLQYLQSANNEACQRYWNGLLDRAYMRVRGGKDSGPENSDSDEYIITPQDRLWVVPCKAGREAQAVFRIFNRATHPTSPHQAGPAAMFNPSQPGRIYIEARNEKLARDTIEGIPGLLPSLLKPVPSEETRHCVSIFPRPMPLWARIRDSRKKWKAVNGTVGVIVPVRNKDNQEETWTIVVAYKDSMQASPQWSWKSVKIGDIHFVINTDELPTVKDIQRFSNCPLVDEHHLNVLFERIYRTNIRPGARICVTRGDFVGSVGEVVSTSGYAADVRLEDGKVETVPLETVRRAFVIGDQAIISTLPWRGTVGWVVDVDKKHLTIWSDLTQTEYRVAAIEAEFFCSSFRQSFSLPPTIKRRNVTEFDIRERFKGRTVYITGHHPLKGKRGTIRETHPDGRIWIQMESVLVGNQTVMLKHTDLSLIEEETEFLVPLPGRNSVSTKPTKSPFSQLDALMVSDTMTPSDHEEHPKDIPSDPESLPVVDNSLTFPDTAPILLAPAVDPYWLIDACFHTRIKLTHVHDPNHIVQLIGRGSAPGLVQVRDRTEVLELAYDSLTALHPQSKNDLVVVLSGSHIGSVYKVVEVHELHSQVKKPGRVLRKKEVDPTFNNDILVQAFGAYR